MHNIDNMYVSFAVKFGKLAVGLCNLGSGFNPV